MPNARIDATRRAAIDRLAMRELDETGLPGMALGVTGPAGPPEVQVHGLADLASRRPVEADTLFEIGSIGKSFTAIVILQLAEEGLLDLDAPIAEALRWFAMPVVGRPVTAHDLLTHTAGITVGLDATPEPASQALALRDRRPGSAPGERFHYSNLGYKILGLVIETIEGRQYPDVLRTRILEPLGMSATEPAITNAIRPRLAVGYDYLHDDRIGFPGQPLVPAAWVETATADGSIASTAGDMATFARMILHRGEGPRGRLLTDASFARMATPHAWPAPGSGYGYALARRTIEGRTYLGHPGGMIGYLAALQVDPAGGLAAVVLENGVMGSPMALARAVLGAARGAEGSTSDADRATTPGAGASPGGQATGRAAIYRVDGPGAETDQLEIVDGLRGPILHRRGCPPLPLQELGDGRFLAPDQDLDRFALCFDPADGRPDVAWHGPARFIRDGAAVAPLPPPDPAVAALAGQYRSHDPWVTNFRVILRGDVPWLLFAAAPDGFEDEQPLVARDDGSWRVGDDPLGPEDIRFDMVVGGRPLRAWLSGYPYFRVG